MADFTYSTPTMADMEEIARLMRAEDRREVTGLWGEGNLLEAVQACLSTSVCAYICKYKGKPLAAFGVRADPIIPRVGVIWMLATTETARHKIYTGKWTRRGIRAFLNDWDYLYNYVDAGNDQTIAWLKWIGAKVYPPEPFGLYGVPYHKFTFGEA